MTLPQLEWRAETPDDAALLREIHDLNRPDLRPLPEPLRTQMLDMQYRARNQGYAQSYPHARRLMLLHGAQAVGHLLLAEDEQSVHLVDFAIHPHWQNRGLGSAALTRLLAHAGQRPVSLQVASGSPAQALYARHGFQATERTAMHLTMLRHPPAP